MLMVSKAELIEKLLNCYYKPPHHMQMCVLCVHCVCGGGEGDFQF